MGPPLDISSTHGPVILWDIEAIQPQITTLGVECCIAFSSDGELLATGMVLSIGISDGHTGEQLRRIERGSMPEAMFDLEFSIDNSRLFIGSYSTILIYDVTAGKVVDKFSTLKKRIQDVTLHGRVYEHHGLASRKKSMNRAKRNKRWSSQRPPRRGTASTAHRR